MRKKNRILVVGCGGIGCELLKLLSVEDVESITIIDNDTIDISNLNRQFLFKRNDVGKSKAMVAARSFNRMRDGCAVFPIHADIMEFDARFFAEYDIVYSCLDNIEARRYVNQRCFISRTPLVDGGSGGFKGQAYYIDYLSECFDCIPKRIPKEHLVCTIRSRPKTFEHCVIWVKHVFLEMTFRIPPDDENYYEDHLKSLVENCDDMSSPEELNRLRGSSEYMDRSRRIVEMLKTSNPSFDKDNLNVMEYIYDVAYIRAQCAGIEPKSFDDTVTIAGNIIPSISTTNSIVASLMILSARNKCNYYSVDNKNIISRLDSCDKNPGCRTCSHDWYGMLYKDAPTFRQLIKGLTRCARRFLAYSDDDTFLTLDMIEHLDDEINIRNNMIAEIISVKDVTSSKKRMSYVYFLNHGDDLYFGRIYRARLGGGKR